jgi:hypothetical protein
MISCIFFIIVIASIFTLLITLIQKKNKRDEKFGNKIQEIKEKTGITKLNSLIEKQKQKRRIYKPIGKSVFLNTDDEKLGDIIEIISNQNNQTIGYKVKENKSEKVLYLFVEHCSQQKNNYICTPDCFTIPSKAIEGLEFSDNINPDIISLSKDNIASKGELEKIYIEQDGKLRKKINHLYALNKMVQGSLYVLKKQHILIEDSLKEVQKKRAENMISQEQYIQMALPCYQMLRGINQNIKKYRELTKRLTQTSLGKLDK